MMEHKPAQGWHMTVRMCPCLDQKRNEIDGDRIEKVDQKPRATWLVVGALWDAFIGAHGLMADFPVGDEDKVGSGQEGHHQDHWSFMLPSQMDLSFLSNLPFQALPGCGFRSFSL